MRSAPKPDNPSKPPHREFDPTAPQRLPSHAEDRSPHILNTSATLLGFCFIVVTSIRVMDLSYKTVIDEASTIATLFFMTSCLLSFLSIRGDLRRARRLENAADYAFLGGLVLLFVTTLLFSLNVIE